MVEAPPAPPPPYLPPRERNRQGAQNEQEKIEITVFLAFLSFLIILILGLLRSRGNKFLRTCSAILFLIADKLITYTTGLMGQFSSSSDLYILWITFLAYLQTLANNSSCYTLEDNEDRKKNLVIDYAVAWSLIFASLQASLSVPEILVPVALIFWIVVLKIRETKRALAAATRSAFGMAKVAKVVSDYQSNHHDGGLSTAYFVTGRYKKRKHGSEPLCFELEDVITTNNVLEGNRGFFTTTKGGKDLRETCFSFAMFWILLARVSGYYNVDMRINFDKLLVKEEHHEEINTIEGIGASPEPLVIPSSSASHSKTKIQDEEEHEVLFRLVEKELDFMYDYLYTNSYAIYARGVFKKLLHLGVIVLFFFLALPLFVEYRTQDHNAVYVKAGGHVLDTGLTRFVILAIFVSEVAQLIMFLVSKWGRVMCTCALVRRGSTRTTMVKLLEFWIRIVSSIPRPTFKFLCCGGARCAKVKVGQYSILKCYDKIPFRLWISCWIGGYVEIPRKGQSGAKYIELSSNIKKAIVSCLNKCSGGVTKLTNGITSLLDNNISKHRIRKYLTNYKLESQAHVILMWHIATSELETECPPDKINHFQVATTISKYCAYLVVFNPQMIPGPVHTTECEFDNLVKELEKQTNQLSNVQKHRDDEDPEEMKCINNGSSEESVLSKGRELKEILKDDTNDIDLWKTLAEFWTEMLLFLALCSDSRDRVDTHLNRLSVGGELMTHLWALLKHKGCKKISPPTSILVEQMENNDDKDEAKGEGDPHPHFTSICELYDLGQQAFQVVSDYMDLSF